MGELSYTNKSSYLTNISFFTMLTLSSIMIGSMQPKVLGEFYEKVLGIKADTHEEGWYGFLVGKTYLTIGEHSEMSGKNKQGGRIMMNLETTDVKGEFDRIKDIEGIEIIKEPYEIMGAWIATLADPDGNYFQLMPPWEPEK